MLGVVCSAAVSSTSASYFLPGMPRLDDNREGCQQSDKNSKNYVGCCHSRCVPHYADADNRQGDSRITCNQISRHDLRTLIVGSRFVDLLQAAAITKSRRNATECCSKQQDQHGPGILRDDNQAETWH